MKNTNKWLNDKNWNNNQFKDIVHNKLFKISPKMAVLESFWHIIDTWFKFWLQFIV
jgi:hypothetical protein